MELFQIAIGYFRSIHGNIGPINLDFDLLHVHFVRASEYSFECMPFLIGHPNSGIKPNWHFVLCSEVLPLIAGLQDYLLSTLSFAHNILLHILNLQLLFPFQI